jgi:hypothetical protein
MLSIDEENLRWKLEFDVMFGTAADGASRRLLNSSSDIERIWVVFTLLIDVFSVTRYN